jgi:hypothetical protein
MSTVPSKPADVVIAEAEISNPPTNPPSVILRDPRSEANMTNGGEGPDMLISNAGNDTLKGKGGKDIYVINNTNYEREVTIIDRGIKWLVINGGDNMMKLDIQKDAVLLDDKPLARADNNPNAFILQIDNLTLLIKQDYDVSRKSSIQTTEAAAPTNPILQNMPHLPPESKLAVLIHMHEQMQQQEANFKTEANNHLG